MLKISILAVGKIREPFLQAGIAEYRKRLSAYARLSIEETADEAAPEKASPAQRAQILQKEGERLLRKIPAGTYVVALDKAGEKLSSEALAERLEALSVSGTSHVLFIIGGSLGLSREVKERADRLLSFSDMTFPHGLFRLMLLEQLYRAFRIARCEPYHK